jgi:hypothetical protein
MLLLLFALLLFSINAFTTPDALELLLLPVDCEEFCKDVEDEEDTGEPDRMWGDE